MPGPYTYEFPRPSVTVDVVAFGLDGPRLRALFIRRGREPYKGKWALPGGFLEMEEYAAEGARRELFEETGLVIEGPIWPLGFYADPDRDPRGRTISLVYVGLVRGPLPELAGTDDASEAKWLEVDADGMKKLDRRLAFDHGTIVRAGLIWLLTDLKDDCKALGLLPETFGRDDVARLFEAVGLEALATCWLKMLLDREVVEKVSARPVRYRAAYPDRLDE